MQHTKGPWRSTSGQDIHVDGRIIARLHAPYDMKHDEYLANARLIAAAPELFDIVKAVLDACNETGPNSLNHVLYRVVQQRGAALLAKIEGDE